MDKQIFEVPPHRTGAAAGAERRDPWRASRAPIELVLRISGFKCPGEKIRWPHPWKPNDCYCRTILFAWWTRSSNPPLAPQYTWSSCAPQIASSPSR